MNGQTLEYVGDFTYLGSLISEEDATQKDIRARLGKAHCVFVRLQSICKSKQYTLRTKVRFYSSNVKSVLLYGLECWRVTIKDMKKIDAFHNRCLRKICCIFWPVRKANEELFRMTKCNSLVLEIKHRQLRWLGRAQNGPGLYPTGCSRMDPTQEKKKKATLKQPGDGQ